MRKLQKILHTERKDVSPYSQLSAESISRIAAQCGRDEVADAHILIKQLQAERVTVPDWDGDTEDDIWRAIALFRAILASIQR
jgi:hypothetical protein